MSDWLKQAFEAQLRKWDADLSLAEELATQTRGGTVFWQTEGLSLLRVYSPMAFREEAFLGNALLNDFIFKAVPRAAARMRAGEIVMVVNDLENAYFLWRGSSDVHGLAAALKDEVREGLSGLYFSPEDEERGIHGSLTRMFTFTKSDFEPFPVYCVPTFLARDLEKAVRGELKKLLDPANFSKETARKPAAALAFFYGQKSGGTGDVQSFATFLIRLAEVYKVLSPKAIGEAFGLKELNKKAVKDAFDEDQFDPEKLRIVFLKAAETFWNSIDRSEEDWLLGFIRKDGKLIDLTPENFTTQILLGVQVGFVAVAVSESNINVLVCRLYGMGKPVARERFISVGLGFNRFHNQRIRQFRDPDSLVMSARFAISSYLAQKAIGTRPQSVSGKLPQLPRLHTVIFHYGQNAPLLEAFVNAVMLKLREYKSIEEMVKSLAGLKSQTHISAINELDPLEAILLDEALRPGVEVLREMTGGDAEAKVLVLGTGERRLMVIAMPPPRAGQKDALDLPLKRFSASRLAAFTLLGLLAKLTNDGGPFYFRCLPHITESDEGVFYVDGRGEKANVALTRYSAIAEFARRVVKFRSGHSRLVEWIALAEEVERDPLATISKVMRRSPLGAGADMEKAMYMRCSNSYYAKLIEQARQWAINDKR